MKVTTGISPHNVSPICQEQSMEDGALLLRPIHVSAYPARETMDKANVQANKYEAFIISISFRLRTMIQLKALV